MKRIILGIFMLAATGTLVAAQLYRWVDEKGNVEYRDTPPPSSAKKVEQRSMGGGTVETSSLPFSVQQAVRNYPVTLWNTSCGAPCDQARAHLARRGVPHTEKDPQSDVEAFKKLTGGIDVPVIFIGATRIKGYFEGEWDSALDIAGYPRTAPPSTKPTAKGPGSRTARGDLPPVKLYTHPECGSSCSAARTLLNDRGVRFEEVVTQEDSAIAELQKVSGDTRVPVLLVGQTVMRGFHAPNYQDLLDSVGFPRAQ
jgi:glutaredoxin